MGSKKKRLKAKFANQEAQVRRTDELRALFNGAPAAASVAASGESRTSTPTPTPTLPTATNEKAQASASTEATRVLRYENTRREKNLSSTQTARVESDSTARDVATSEARPALRTVIASQPYSPAKRLDAAEPKSTERPTDWWLGPVLIFAAVVTLGLGWLHIDRAGVVAHPVGHNTATLEAFNRESRQKIEYYRSQLGHRLNRDRVNVELMNSSVAPALEPSAVPRVDRSMMSGVPLMQENYVDQNYGSQSATNPVPIDRPDARIQYGLQEEQHRDEFDRRVQQEYIREFVENARRDGVNVTIDKDGNIVEVEPIGSRRPGSYQPSLSR